MAISERIPNGHPRITTVAFLKVISWLNDLTEASLSLRRVIKDLDIQDRSHPVQGLVVEDAAAWKFVKDPSIV